MRFVLYRVRTSSITSSVHPTVYLSAGRSNTRIVYRVVRRKRHHGRRLAREANAATDSDPSRNASGNRRSPFTVSELPFAPAARTQGNGHNGGHGRGARREAGGGDKVGHHSDTTQKDQWQDDTGGGERQEGERLRGERWRVRPPQGEDEEASPNQQHSLARAHQGVREGIWRGIQWNGTSKSVRVQPTRANESRPIIWLLFRIQSDSDSAAADRPSDAPTPTFSSPLETPSKRVSDSSTSLQRPSHVHLRILTPNPRPPAHAAGMMRLRLIKAN